MFLVIATVDEVNSFPVGIFSSFDEVTEAIEESEHWCLGFVNKMHYSIVHKVYSLEVGEFKRMPEAIFETCNAKDLRKKYTQ